MYKRLRASTLTYEGWLPAALLGVFALMALLAGLDLVADLSQGASFEHLLAEGGIVLVGLLGAVAMGVRFVRALGARRVAERRAEELTKRLDATSADAMRWRSEARSMMEGLGRALDEQFERWGLSPAEKEVGLLLLKGLSHKEVATVRSVSEATARQQARALYRKAGLAGRHELAAFFLEDLMLPEAADSTRSSGV